MSAEDRTDQSESNFSIATTRENAERVLQALRRFGFALPDSTPEVFMEPNKVHMMGKPPLRIDLLTGPSGVDFRACYARRRIERIDGVDASIIDLADLRANKLASGRDKDLLDLKRLPTAFGQ